MPQTTPLRFAAMLALLGVGWTPAEGLWAPGSIADRVHDCDVIVVGRLGEVTSLGPGLRREWGSTFEETERTRGVIAVERVIWGNVSTGDRLPLVWEDRLDPVCAPFCHHERHERESGIWLLRDAGDGNYRAENTTWFIRLDEEEEVLEALRRQLVIVHQKEWELFQGARYEISLIVRNPSDHAMSIPRFSIAGRHLVLGRGVTIAVEFVPQDNDWQPVAGRAGGVVVTGETVIVDPGREHRLDLDLREYFEVDVPEGYYRVRFAVDGLPGDSRAQWIVWDEPPPVAPVPGRLTLWVWLGCIAAVAVLALAIWARRRRRRNAELRAAG